MVTRYVYNQKEWDPNLNFTIAEYDGLFENRDLEIFLKKLKKQICEIDPLQRTTELYAILRSKLIDLIGQERLEIHVKEWKEMMLKKPAFIIINSEYLGNKSQISAWSLEAK